MIARSIPLLTLRHCRREVLSLPSLCLRLCLSLSLSLSLSSAELAAAVRSYWLSRRRAVELVRIMELMNESMSVRDPHH